MKVSTSGTYAGIGVEVVPGKGGVSVVGRMAGSPAERAGIRTGDVIVRIDDVAVDPANLEAAIARMRGPEGSAIRLSVRRDGRRDAARFPGRARARAAAERGRGAADAGLRLPAHHHLHRYHRRRTGRAVARLERSHAGSSMASSSTCATIRAACSMRRCRSPMIFSITAPSSVPRAGLRMPASAWRPSPATSPTAPGWCCWSMAARPRHRKFLRRRCMTIIARR